jgi:hypothetical protein
MSEHFKIISDCLDRMDEKDAEIERLRAALRDIVQIYYLGSIADEARHMMEIAKEALQEERRQA